MTNTEESLSIAEALQRISDLTEQAKREEAARQTDILEGLSALEAAETELKTLKAKARVAADGEAAVRALVTLGWPRDTGKDPEEWAKEMRAAGPGEFEVQNQVWAMERPSSLIVESKRTRRLARAAAWAWYDSTTETQRAEMLRQDELKRVHNVIKQAAMLIRQYGAPDSDAPLSDAVGAFADDLR